MNDMIILRERVITIKAGDTFDQNLQGNVLRVTAGLVPLRVQDRDGQMDFTLLAGERAEFPGEFPGLILSHSSGADQTFTVQVGKGVNVASALVSGVVSITGTPTVINGGGNLTSIQNTVKTYDDPVKFGASFKSVTALAAGAVETIFSPASNPNGAIVSFANLINQNPTTWSYYALLAKNSAPTSNIDGDLILSPNAGCIGNSGYVGTVSIAKLDRDVYIQPGKGLYIYADIALIGLRSVLYKLL